SLLSLGSSKALFQRIDLFIQSLGKTIAEVREVLLDERHFRQPTLDVYTEKLLNMRALYVETSGIEIGDLGNPADWGLRGVHLSVTTLKNPFQNAAVFAEARPQKLAIRILTKPVDVENFRQLRWLRVLTYLEPMAEVVAHVVAAEPQHGPGIAAQLSGFPRDGGGGLAAHGRAQKSSMPPIESFRDQRNDSR